MCDGGETQYALFPYGLYLFFTMAPPSSSGKDLMILGVSLFGLGGSEFNFLTAKYTACENVAISYDQPSL